MKSKFKLAIALAVAVAASGFLLAGTLVPANPGLIVTRKAVTTVYNIRYSDYYLACSGTNYTVTLPAVSDGRVGCTFRIGAVGTNTVTLAPASGDTISGSTNSITVSNLTSVTITSDGVSNWEQ